MTRVDPFAVKFQRILESLPVEEARVYVRPTEPNGFYKYIGFVISRSFEGLDEGQRQLIPWTALLANMTDDELERVEFVFPDTPAEVEARTPQAAAAAPQT